MRINPFVPHSTIAPGMFVGRLKELERLEACLVRTRAGEPSHFMVTGERGIGKSSLLRYVKWQAEGLIPVNDEKLAFMVVDVDLDEETTQLALIKKIQLGVSKALAEVAPVQDALRKIWGFVTKIEAAGVRVRDRDGAGASETLADEFAYSLAETVEGLRTGAKDPVLGATRDGLLISIDEAGQGAKALRLGSFLKLLTERLARKGCTSVVIGLAGPQDLRDTLAASHPSAPRAFQEVPLGRLTDDEVSRVIDRCLDRARKEFKTEVTIKDDARRWIVHLSEGYPHFIQQFGYSAYEVDEDDVIDAEDVKKGAFGAQGALKAIGDYYYREPFFKKIREERYRQVLRIMAEKLDAWVTKKEIAKAFKGKPSSLTNAIHALLERKIILPREGQAGVYKLGQQAFALWITRHGTPPEQFTLGDLEVGDKE